MGTTILLAESTRLALARTRDALGASSMDEAIQTILRDATPTAKSLWDRHRKAALAVAKKYAVTRVIAFGSRVRDDRHPGSDLDLVVEFPADGGLDAFFRLREELSAILGVTVDMGDLRAAGPRLLERIKKEGVVLVGPPL